jgi:hypothetical protein
MQTIEQLESDLFGKIGIARDQLAIFQANLGRIGQVIGKDASAVYMKILGYVDQIELEMKTTTLRNTALISRWVGTMDKVLAVLKEVMASIDTMNNAADGEVLNVRATVEMILNKASDSADGISTYIMNYADPTADPGQASILKYILIGTAAYFTLRMFKISPLVSGIGAVAAAIILGGRAATPVAPSVPVVVPPVTPEILV